jgi:aldehyde:ferredoxin oxidoreductase
MATSYGWTGKILRVDLTAGKITETPTSDYTPKFIGGRGIGDMIYWELVPPQCKAFDPENALIMMTGPATGTLAPAAGKFSIISKTPLPLTECYSYSAPGGHWGAELKFAGYDGVVVTGKSPKPVYLWINDGKAELRNANRLWGMKVSALMLEMYSLHGPQTRVLGIGPAGENLCRDATIIVDLAHATGIPGFGSVMGSKNLKAIAVLGTGAVSVAKPKELIDLWYYYRRLLNRTPAEVASGGGWPHQVKSIQYYQYHAVHHVPSPGVPTKSANPAAYFKNMGLDDPYLLMTELIKKGTVKMKWGGCYGCPVCCELTWQSQDVDLPSGGGQCSDMLMWSSHEWVGLKKLTGAPSIWFNTWANDLGLSQSTTGGWELDWFWELVQRGIFTKENTGLPVDKMWSEEFIKGFLENYAYRRGKLFDRMAEGQDRFLKSLSDENPAVKPVYDLFISKQKGYFGEWKGYEYRTPGISAIVQAAAARHDPNRPSGGAGKALSTSLAGLTTEQAKEVFVRGNLKYFGVRDATDLSGEPKTWNNKVATAILMEKYSVNVDCITMCCWAGFPAFYSQYTPDYLGDPASGAKVYSAVTGIEMSNAEMIAAMDPIFNLERSIFVREGRRRVHDTFNDVIYTRAPWSWTSKAEFEGKVMDEYYTARGWDLKTGIPRRSTLEKLGLKSVADELESKYKVTVPA